MALEKPSLFVPLAMLRRQRRQSYGINRSRTLPTNPMFRSCILVSTLFRSYCSSRASVLVQTPRNFLVHSNHWYSSPAIEGLIRNVRWSNAGGSSRIELQANTKGRKPTINILVFIMPRISVQLMLHLFFGYGGIKRYGQIL